MRDVILRVREEQLIREHGLRLLCLGIEIEHSRLQLGRFPRHHLAEAPKGGTGQLPGALPFEHLRTPGDEPQALLGHCVRVCDALHECERARRCPLDSCRQACGRRVRPLAILRDEMHHAGKGHVRGQALDERSPGLAPIHLDRCLDDPAVALRR